MARYRVLAWRDIPTQVQASDETGAPVNRMMARWFMQDVLLTFGGGANEVHRNIVAMVGLGMPRA